MPIPLSCRARRALLVLMLLAPAGCAGQGTDYPSLAPRAIEQMSLAEPATKPAPPQVADPAAVARFAPAIERAQSADAAFTHALAQERGALTKGRSAAFGSDGWAAAQVSLSRLQDAREPVIKLLAELDAARNAEPTQTNTGEAIAAAQAFDVVQKIDGAEAAALTAVWPNVR